MRRVTKAPQNAPDNGVAAALLSVVRSPDPASALRPSVMTLMPRRNRPTPPRTEIVVDMRAPPGCYDSQVIRCAGPALRLAGQCCACCRQLLLLFRVDLRVREIKLLNRFHDRSADDQSGEPPVVGWHHEPGRALRGGGANGIFVCPHVVAPELSFVHVRGRELPVLLWRIEAPQEALLLFLARQVKEELEDDDSLPSEVILEVRDVGESLVPDALADQRPGQVLLVQDILVHANDQDLLVVRAVEDSDLSALGQTTGIPPQKVVAEVLL